MRKNKIILIFLIIVFCTTISSVWCGKNFDLSDVKLLAKEWSKNQDEIKQIINFSPTKELQDLLVNVVEHTQLTRKISSNELNAYVGIMDAVCKVAVCTNNKSILTAKIADVIAIKYALKFCSHNISLIAYLAAAKILKYDEKLKVKLATSDQQEERKKMLAKQPVFNLSKIVEYLKNPLEMEFFGSLNNEYEFDVYARGGAFYYLSEKNRVGSITFRYSPSSCKIIIDQFFVHCKYRHRNIGGILLNMVIELSKQLCCKKKLLKIQVFASSNEDDNNLFQPILIDYFKSFGFIPNKNNSNNLTLYIKNGNILPGYDEDVTNESSVEGEEEIDIIYKPNSEEKKKREKLIEKYIENLNTTTVLNQVSNCLKTSSGKISNTSIDDDIILTTDIQYDFKFGHGCLNHTVTFSLTRMVNSEKIDVIASIEIDYRTTLKTLYIAHLETNDKYRHYGFGSFLVKIAINLAKIIGSGTGTHISLFPSATPSSMQETLVAYYCSFGFGKVESDDRQKLYIDANGNIIK